MARLPVGVRKRKDGTLEKRFTIDGKRYSVYGANTKELTDKESDLRDMIRNKIYLANKNITLDKYFEEWLKRKENTVKGNSIYTYKKIYNWFIKSELGDKKVTKIEKREIFAFHENLQKKTTPSTSNYVIKLLKTILNGAVDDDIIVKNPSSTIKPIKVEKKATKTIHRALTIQEQDLFMSELKKQESYYYNLISFLLLTGLRFGEAVVLTWSDIDLKNNLIHIDKTLSFDMNGKRIIGDSPKSESGERDIPINNNIRQVLNRARGVSNILPYPTNLVFPSITGKIIYNNVLNNEIKRIIKVLSDQGKEIDIFTVHAFRDTFATRYIEQGGSPQTLKNILGHSSYQMTMDLYSHVLPNTKAEEMSKIQINIG